MRFSIIIPARNRQDTPLTNSSTPLSGASTGPPSKNRFKMSDMFFQGNGEMRYQTNQNPPKALLAPKAPR